MSRYIKWDDVVSRYKRASDISDSDEMATDYIDYAEKYIESKLSTNYTLPFSSNNLTVKDLCIDVAYAKMIKYKDSKKANEILSDVSSYIHDLKTGQSNMITNSFDVISPINLGGAFGSTTKSYHPVFGVGETEVFHVSSSQLLDEENARS